MNEIAPSTLFLRENDRMPNNAVLPVLIYRKVFDAAVTDKHKRFQHWFEKNGWQGVWKNGLYDYHHFHPASHEVLGIASGFADVLLGGEGGKTITLDAGDVVVLPAGTGHKRLSASENLVIIGAYPQGQENYSICRHRNDCEERNVAAAVATVPLPSSDPLYGANGPLMTLWRV